MTCQRLERVKNKRTGAWVELPADDGLVALVVWEPDLFGRLEARHVLLDAARAAGRRRRLQQRMRVHDARSRKERWGGNQWGEGWVTRPQRRWQLEAKAPLLKTDLSLTQWRRVAA